MHDFSWSWIFSSPHFSSNRRVSLCSQILPRVLVFAAILHGVLVNTIDKLSREVALLNTVLDVFC